jgi:hypothetical protein
MPVTQARCLRPGAARVPAYQPGPGTAMPSSGQRPPEQLPPRDRPAAGPAAMGAPGCRTRMPGPAARSVMHLTIGRRQVAATDCNEQSVISSSQSAHNAEYLRPINSSSSRAGIAQKRQFWRCLPCGVLRDRIVLAAPSRCCAGRCRRAWTRALLTTDFRACRQHDGSGRPKPGQRRYQAGKPQLPLVMAASCPGHGGRARSPDQRVHASRRTPATAAPHLR